MIATVAVVIGAIFLPIGLIAGLTWKAAFLFAIGLLVANVPEGLLPTITLALAAGGRTLARLGAVVKRLSSVETLGCTTVICTDKTGTLTQNRMEVAECVVAEGIEPQVLVATAARCTTTDPERDDSADATEAALLRCAVERGVRVDAADRDAGRQRMFAFDSRLMRMSTVDAAAGCVTLHTKGAPERVLPLCSLDAAAVLTWQSTAEAIAARGLRVLAVARRDLTHVTWAARGDVEKDLEFLGLIGLLDPPRPEVPEAVSRCHTAGITVHMVTGDNGSTAAEVARRVGIGADRIVDGAALDGMSERELDALFGRGEEIVFARTQPESKLRITDALHDLGHIVAMTGDGVNDAPALRRADIGVAMGLSGTDVARQSATMVITDDNFATITLGVREGRRIYDNVRKFLVYIFAHAVPEVVPFLVFALSGGAIPLPLTVLQILAIDLGTETLPALALGREPAEKGLMHRPPRPAAESVITATMLLRAWLIMGVLSAGLVMAAYFIVLYAGGWQPGVLVTEGSPMNHVHVQATTMSFAAIVACQVGTAMACRTSHASLRSVGVFTNPLLLGGIAFELLFAAAVVYVAPLQVVFGTAALDAWMLGLLVPMPLLVWGVDEAYRWAVRRSGSTEEQQQPAQRPRACRRT